MVRRTSRQTESTMDTLLHSLSHGLTPGAYFVDGDRVLHEKLKDRLVWRELEFKKLIVSLCSRTPGVYRPYA
jgi:hypothetical protein